jgi:hypothetical protein
MITSPDGRRVHGGAAVGTLDRHSFGLGQAASLLGLRLDKVRG